MLILISKFSWAVRYCVSNVTIEGIESVIGSKAAVVAKRSLVKESKPFSSDQAVRNFFEHKIETLCMDRNVVANAVHYRENW